jgi:hypothetical protein
MATTGQRLAQVQLRGHLRIDTVFADLANDAEQAVLTEAERSPGNTLTPASSLSVITALRGKLSQASPQLLVLIMGSVQEAVIAALDGEVLTTNLAGQALDQFQSRQQVVRTLQGSQPAILEQSTALLLAGVAKGLTNSQMAKQLRQYFAPFFSPRRSVTGKLMRADRKGAVRSWPGRAGMASNLARSVMLDQSGRMHARTTYRLAVQNNLGLQYSLSYQHRDNDECTFLRYQDVGYGPGIYPADDAPQVPRHRRCRCYYSTAPLR